MKKLKVYETPYQLLNLTKEKTTNNSTVYNVDVLSIETGELITACYFGNTKPKVIMSIKEYTTKAGKVYNIAEIQPHQCRNKFGRFISAKR